MKVLVTGRQGQLARALGKAGQRANMHVVTLGRPDLDLAQPQSIISAFETERPDVVINAAAYTSVDKAEREPEFARAINALGAESVARAAAAHDTPLIHVSTDYVFDGTAADFYREDDPVGPVGTYGASKLEGERLVAACALRHVIVRTAWVHSPWGQNFVRTMLRLAAMRDDVGVVDDQLGSPTYAPHLADALIAIAEQINGNSESGPWGTFHAVNAGETTWCGLAREIFRQAARHGLPVARVKPIATADYPTPARRPANSRLACGKLQRTFGLALPDWRQGVADCVARLAAERNARQSATVSNSSESQRPKT